MNAQIPAKEISDLYDELETAGALELVRAAFKDRSAERLLRLEIAIAEACVEARRYQNIAGPDWLERRRVRDRMARRELPALSKGVKKLRKFFARFPESAVSVASLLSKAKGLDEAGKPAQALRDDAPRACDDFLVALQRVLETAKATANKRGFLHGWQVGPFLYPKYIAKRQGSRPKATETGLAFQLTLYFRRFSAGKKNFEYLQNGEPMPAYGAPHYELSAAILEVAVGRSVRPSALRRRLDALLFENKGIALASWPRH